MLRFFAGPQRVQPKYTEVSFILPRHQLLTSVIVNTTAAPALYIVGQ